MGAACLGVYSGGGIGRAASVGGTATGAGSTRTWWIGA